MRFWLAHALREYRRFTPQRNAICSDRLPRQHKTGRDKTAIMFEIPNGAGALYDTLAPFKQNKVNLTWIESFPTPLAKGEYVFFVDFEGHMDQPKVKRTLQNLTDLCEKVQPSWDRSLSRWG